MTGALRNRKGNPPELKDKLSQNGDTGAHIQYGFLRRTSSSLEGHETGEGC